jgi:signal transduction histidine kinase/DNA-binding response OmpR family regulator/ligand-binding sensor domain-containing protein
MIGYLIELPTMKKTIKFSIFIFILSVQLGWGGDFRYLRTNEGLYNGEINSIAQDKSGKMWFATWAGLTSYNGYDFQFFKPELGNPLSLPDKKTNRIFIDSNDNLWVASLSGVSLFRKEDQTFRPFIIDGLESTNYYVFNFFDSKGNVLIHTNAGIYLVYTAKEGGNKLRTKKMTLDYQNLQVNDYVHYMNVFKDELVMVSNADSYNPARILIGELKIDSKDTLIKVSRRITYHHQINAVCYVKDEEKLFLGTTDGVSLMSLPQYSITDHAYYSGLNIQNMLAASDHKVYCYTTDPTLLYIDLKLSKTGQYLPDPLKIGSLLDNNIMCLFEDFSGNLWVGHQGLGLSILNLNRKAFSSFKRDPSGNKSLNGNIVMCFNSTKQEVLVGLRQGGLNVTPKRMREDGSAEFSIINYGQQDRPVSVFDNIWDIARESDSLFWIASDGGLAKLEKTSKGWIYGKAGERPLYIGVVRKVLIDKDRNIWFGTFAEGLKFIPALRKNPDKKVYSFPPDPSDQESISNKTVLSMCIDSKNRFWVGTNNGLNLVKTSYNKLDLSGHTKPDVRFTQLIASKPEKHFLNANEINCIYENKDGKIWVATQGGGINLMDADSLRFTHLTTENGLPGNDVLGILSDHSGVKWISTNKGIVSYDTSNKTKPFTYYSQSDGLQGETFKVNSYYQAADGELFFGGDNGFTRFFPEQIKFNPIPPKVGFTNLRIENKIVNIGDTINKGNIMACSLNELDQIELPFNKNSFSIGVGIHHFQYPEGNQIRYKLDGFNERWITMPALTRNIYFSKLPYGEYTLRVSGVSADNVEAESERLLGIKILPPWYKTWYIRTLVLLLLISLVGFVLYWIANQQRISFQKKIDAITFENNENKMRFLTNIAHELRTPLSLVIAPIEDMKQNYTSIDAKWKNHLNLIYRNSNYLLTLINQIIDFRKLNAGKLQMNLQTTDIVSLVRDVVGNFKGMESRRKTNLQLQVPDQSVLVDIDSQKIEEVMYNLLSNAFKHTSENHSIKVSLEVQNGKNNEKDQTCVRITVFNEGKDISDEDKVRIFERFYKVSEKVEGAGIGLSFSKSLIEMHNGTITVESVDGIGVAFHVDLYFNQIEINQPVAGQDILWYEDVYGSDQVHELENKGKDLTIVIVEDNSDLRTFLKKTLSTMYHCHEAGDGKEGYELITRILPDIVISDVIMPKMDGYELCVKIKENSKTCHIPIILLTANNASDHIISGYEKGADAYVTKPFDMSIIKAQISRLIKNRELIREKYMTQNFMVEVSTSNLSKDDEFIVRLRQLLEDNLSETDFNVKKLSSDLNISTTHLYRKLKALTGLSPVEFIRVFKLQKACEMLTNTNYSIKEVGYGLGFNNLSYFVKCFREQFGVTPSSFRQKGLPEQIKIDNTNQSVMS